MSMTRTVGIAAAALALLASAACSATEDGDDSSGGGGSSGYGAPAAPESESAAAQALSTLSTAESEFGTIVVDGKGMTLYQFDQDEPGSGTSTCQGQCAKNWPAAPGGQMPELEGITGDVESITGVDGAPQLSLNGWPLYYYIGDEQPGDVTGQGVGEVWWVLTPAGEPIRN